MRKMSITEAKKNYSGRTNTLTIKDFISIDLTDDELICLKNLIEEKFSGEKIKCPNCQSEVEEDELRPSLLTDSLLCCPYCKGKSKHTAVIGKV